MSIVAAQVEATSLREVAHRAGMSHSGLHRVLTGASIPMSRTVRKLVRVCLTEPAEPNAAAELEVARFVLRRLVDRLPESGRAEAIRGILREMGPLARGWPGGLPAWVAALYAEVEPPEPASEKAAPPRLGRAPGDGRAGRKPGGRG